MIGVVLVVFHLNFWVKNKYFKVSWVERNGYMLLGWAGNLLWWEQPLLGCGELWHLSSFLVVVEFPWLP